MGMIIFTPLLISLSFIPPTDASVDHTAPQFTLEPKDTIIPEGKPTTLQCRATGKPSPTYSWKRNGIDIVIAPGTRERLLSNGDLYISKVDASMVGRYQCVVKVIYSAVSLTILSRTANLKMSGMFMLLFIFVIVYIVYAECSDMERFRTILQRF